MFICRANGSIEVYDLRNDWFQEKVRASLVLRLCVNIKSVMQTETTRCKRVLFVSELFSLHTETICDTCKRTGEVSLPKSRHLRLCGSVHNNRGQDRHREQDRLWLQCPMTLVSQCSMTSIQSYTSLLSVSVSVSVFVSVNTPYELSWSFALVVTELLINGTA